MMVPVASRDNRPLPPLIKTTLARALRAGLSRRTGGVLTMNVVSTVTASAARAVGEALQTPNAAHAARINADRLSSFACQTDISLSFKLRSAQVGRACERADRRRASSNARQNKSSRLSAIWQARGQLETDPPGHLP